MKVTVVARFRVLPGGESRARAAAQAVVAPTRAEEGCVNYDLHSLLDDPREFMFHENWRSKADLDHHLSTPHVAAFLADVKPVVDGDFDVTLWHEHDG